MTPLGHREVCGPLPSTPGLSSPKPIYHQVEVLKLFGLRTPLHSENTVLVLFPL